MKTGIRMASPSSSVFLDRELSQLSFNRRVLAQAEDSSIPLLERLRYLCIVSNNLDEFFEIRVASLLAKGGQDGAARQQADLERINHACHELVRQQYAILNTEILPQLQASGVRLLRHAERNEAQRAWVRDYFETQVRPLLTPIGLDPAHPFPRVVNKSLNFIIALSGKDAFGRGTGAAIVKAPRVLPRVLRLPDRLAPHGSAFCLLSSVIRAHVDALFAGRRVLACSQFRVTRDSDLWVDEEEVKNLRQALKGELQERQFGTSVRLEVGAGCPPELARLLLGQFGLDPACLYQVDGPVNLAHLSGMIEHVEHAALRFAPFVPGLPRVGAHADLFEQLRRQDILLHHPFQSFQCVIDFIRMAAHDPAVVAIKQTIYRTGIDSGLMEALMAAARMGKEVTVILELKARFDEEANINWADKLEHAGAQVVYGVVGLKTHAKIALVIRREAPEPDGAGSGLRFYAHLGTGNYHLTTTRLYTDFGLLTAHQGIGGEVNEVFIHLTSLARPHKLRHLWLAPFALQGEIIKAIRREAKIARAGRPGRIIAKVNALVDEAVIRALYAASRDGVRIDLIVRGACTLRPGLPGLSDNIRVRSVIGRFLEHSRVYYFRNDLAHDVYLASADWMSRNLVRRVEVAFPVLDPALKRRVIAEGLKPYLKDNLNSWKLGPGGRYQRRKARAGQAAFSAQCHLMQLLGAADGQPAEP